MDNVDLRLPFTPMRRVRKSITVNASESIPNVRFPPFIVGNYGPTCRAYKFRLLCTTRVERARKNMVYAINTAMLESLNTPEDDRLRRSPLAWVKGSRSMTFLISAGTFSTGKKVLHRKVMGRITKVENLDMSEWVVARIAASVPSAAKSMPFKNMTRKNIGDNATLAPKRSDTMRTRHPAYIPLNAPATVCPRRYCPIGVGEMIIWSNECSKRRCTLRESPTEENPLFIVVRAIIPGTRKSMYGMSATYEEAPSPHPSAIRYKGGSQGQLSLF